MSKDINNAIKNAAAKDYSQFEKNVTTELSSKMKEKLSGFMTHLETNIFKPEE